MLIARWFWVGVVLGVFGVGRVVGGIDPLVGAHYYPWYDSARWDYSECGSGTLRGELLPAQAPLLGRYRSDDPVVIGQHLEWCSRYNIGLLILEFYRPGSRADVVSREDILPHPHAGSVTFGVLYDWAIRFGSFDITADRLETVRTDFQHLARHYFSSPFFMRAPDGRPVVFLYVTRALQGDIAGFIRAMREAVFEETGEYPYLVGDEFFFLDTPKSVKIGRWDAIFGYDVYASRGGYWGESGALEFFLSRTRAYQSVAGQAGTVFMPSLMPGFNDRAVRRTCANNPAASRRLTAEAGETSLFGTVFDQILEDGLDPAFPVISITSFNEWHEDTQIEPTVGAGVETVLDTSESGMRYTEGLVYDDYGFSFLELIRDRTVAFSGVVSRDGVPLSGAEVILGEGGGVLGRVVTDTFGRYKVMRGVVESAQGVLTLRAIGEGPVLSEVVEIEVDPVRAVETDLELVVSVVVPELRLLRRGMGLRLEWQTEFGFWYQVLESDDLTIWREVGEPERGTGGVLDPLVAVGEGSACFWKVLVTPAGR